MTGCLTAPFKLLGCLVLVVLLLLGWLYRDRVVGEGRRLLGRLESPAVTAAAGRPGKRSLESARSKIDSLNGWRADSVILTASELASLVGSGMDPALRGQLDSLRVELLEGEIAVRASLRTSRLPKDLVGPLSIALRPVEPVEAVGPLRVTRPGRGEWAVRSFRIRDFPLPAAMVPRLVSRTLGDPRQETVPMKVPQGIRQIRVLPGRAILYGAARS